MQSMEFFAQLVKSESVTNTRVLMIFNHQHVQLLMTDDEGGEGGGVEKIRMVTILNHAHFWGNMRLHP